MHEDDNDNINNDDVLRRKYFLEKRIEKGKNYHFKNVTSGNSEIFTTYKNSVMNTG